jgi:redox-sensitive bicupin YhaK (pirin superfamily)
MVRLVLRDGQEVRSMLTLRRASERGAADHGWLDTKHTFSFAGYYDPRHMGYRALRVINDDRVAPGRGFGTHPHRDMEILTYVLDGALEHQDSMGTGSVIRHGDVQRMSAGRGVLHSEWNHSKTEPVRFLQIWILPSRAGLTPSYEQKHFGEAETRDRWALVASPEGAEGSVVVHQDAKILATRLSPGASVPYVRQAGRHLWLQVANGAVTVNGEALREGDGASTNSEEELVVTATDEAELLLFDLA